MENKGFMSGVGAALIAVFGAQSTADWRLSASNWKLRQIAACPELVHQQVAGRAPFTGRQYAASGGSVTVSLSPRRWKPRAFAVDVQLADMALESEAGRAIAEAFQAALDARDAAEASAWETISECRHVSKAN